MKRSIVLLILALLIALPVFAQSTRLKKGPGEQEYPIAYYTLNDGAFVQGTCASVGQTLASDAACNGSSKMVIPGHDLLITRVDVGIIVAPLTGTEGCDLILDNGGATVATFFIGSPNLKAVGDSETQTDLANTTVSVNNILVARHDAPSNATGPDGCVSGTCACTGSAAGYSVIVYGKRIN